MNRPDGDVKKSKTKAKKGNTKKSNGKSKLKVKPSSRPVEEDNLIFEPLDTQPVRQSEYFDASSEISELVKADPDESFASFKSTASDHGISSPMKGNNLNSFASVSEYVSLNSTLEEIKTTSESFRSEEGDVCLDQTKVNETTKNATFEFQVPTMIPSAMKNESLLDDTRTILEVSETRAVQEPNPVNMLDDTLNLVDDLPVDSESSKPEEPRMRVEAFTSSEFNLEMQDVQDLLFKVKLEIKMANDQVRNPDAPENVKIQTKVILSSLVRNQLMTRVQADVNSNVNVSYENSSSEYDDSNDLEIIYPKLEEDIQALPPVIPGSVEERAAQCVADLGDQIMTMYEHRLNEMIQIIPDDLCPVDMFRQVAHKIFKLNSIPNWGQVVTLMYFGFLLVKRKISTGLLTAFKQIVDCIQNLFQEANIFTWIASQGGWRILEYLQIVTPGAEFALNRSIEDMGNSIVAYINETLVNNLVFTKSLVISATISYAAYLIYRNLLRR